MKLRVISIFLALLLIQPVFAQRAILTESRQSMKTYPFSDPNPTPSPGSTIYPYFNYDGYSVTGSDQEWTVVTLENDYIKVMLFPEIGGKVWGAIDKKTGKQFIYTNDVVKFRSIAMRGPWTSGGIEMNFGIIGHAPTTATPVDYCTSENPDGSVSCWIASYELVTHTLWNVEVRLEKDKAYFTTNTTWHNASSINVPYYQWMNAGYPDGMDMEFCYYGTNYIGHGGDLHPFPVDEKGRDLSWYKNNDFSGSKSYHVLGWYNDFYGAYWHDSDFGTIHYADYEAKLGMKIFIWGLSREGAIWEDLLTDNNGQYVEMQSGRMYNQPVGSSAFTPFRHESFSPQETDSWTEYWFPVENTRGVKKASPAGALNVIREGDWIKIYFSPVQKISGSIKLFDKDKEIKNISVNCNVLEAWKDSIPSSAVKEGRLKVVIGDDQLIYSEVPEDNVANRPKAIPKDFDWNSVYGLYVHGEQLLNQKNYGEAEKYLKQCLEKDKYYLPALTKLASVQYRYCRYEEALENCRTALSLNAYDGEANYFYGLCCKAMGRNTDAKDGFSVAARSAEFRTAAFEKLAEMYLMDGNFAKAEQFALKSLKYNDMNLTAENLLAIIYRRMGKKEEAAKIVDKVLESLPMNYGARFENVMLGRLSEDDFTSSMHAELKHETYLELEDWYEQMGCFDEAEKLLGFASDYPIANYRLAYLKHIQGDETAAESALSKAQSQSPELVFPSRFSSLKALEWAREAKPDWKNDYYAAIVYCAYRNSSKAKELLKGINDSDYAPFYMFRANFESGNERLTDLQQAQKIQDSWRIGLGLINYYMSSGDPVKAEAVGKEYMSKYKDNFRLGLKYANVLCDNGKYKQCLNLLDHLQVLPSEGSSAGRDIYRRANLSMAVDCLNHHNYRKALKCVDDSEVWNENLGVGKPYDDEIDLRLENYIRAKAYEGLKDDAKAQEYRAKVGSDDIASFDKDGILSKLN